MSKEFHNCETLQKSNVDIDIKKIDKRWYWIFWHKTKSQAHEIKYCPYCGEELEKGGAKNERIK